MLDDAEAGDGVEVSVGERGAGDVAGEVLDGAAAGGVGEGEVDAVEIAVAVDEEGREDVRVELGAGVEDMG